MNELSNQTKTMLCVSIAGLFFIPAVIFNMWYLTIIGAFFDWLPLPTGWMKTEKAQKKNIPLVIIHVIVTLIAYAFLILWIVLSNSIYRFLFFEIWWIAVVVGIFLTYPLHYSARF